MVTLGLDISSHTGWAIFYNSNLIGCGIFNHFCNDRSFPWGVYNWAKKCASDVVNLCFQYDFVDNIIVEKTNLGKNREVQSFLEWLHFFLLYQLENTGFVNKIKYIDTSQWRKKINLKLTKEQKQRNKFISQQHKNGNKSVVVDEKRIGKITAKHLSVDFVNKEFGLNLKLKHNDIADAICIAFSHTK